MLHVRPIYWLMALGLVSFVVLAVTGNLNFIKDWIPSILLALTSTLSFLAERWKLLVIVGVYIGVIVALRYSSPVTFSSWTRAAFWPVIIGWRVARVVGPFVMPFLRTIWLVCFQNNNRRAVAGVALWFLLLVVALFHLFASPVVDCDPVRAVVAVTETERVQDSIQGAGQFLSGSQGPRPLSIEEMAQQRQQAKVAAVAPASAVTPAKKAKPICESKGSLWWVVGPWIVWIVSAPFVWVYFFASPREEIAAFMQRWNEARERQRSARAAVQAAQPAQAQQTTPQQTVQTSGTTQTIMAVDWVDRLLSGLGVFLEVFYHHYGRRA